MCRKHLLSRVHAQSPGAPSCAQLLAMLTAGATPRQLALILAICAFAIQGTHALQCFRCKDTGDGGCTPGRAEVITCPYTNDVCLQTITTFNISFASLRVLTKGCGFNSTSASPLETTRQALMTVTDIEACDTNLCNSRQFENTLFPLANISFDSSPLNTSVQCYTCLGITADQCANHCAPIMNCSGDQCAEGYLAIQMRDEEFLTLFYKDCGRWGPFETLVIVGRVGVRYNLKRVICSGELCNSVPPPTTAPTSTRPPISGGPMDLANSPLLLGLLLAAILV
ncbi:ly6/PLAUR domain-containing protein 3-like [Lissotriton helveticus]